MLLDCVAEDIDDRLRSQRSKASRRQLDINPFVWFCRSALDGHICFLASQKFKKISSEIILLSIDQQEMTGENCDVELGLRMIGQHETAPPRGGDDFAKIFLSPSRDRDRPRREDSHRPTTSQQQQSAEQRLRSRQ
jgi:hypothetical protein